MDIVKRLEQETQNTFENLIEIPWANRSVYADWLSQTYHFVRHSTRLLALAAAVASLEQQNWHDKMARHIREELGHERIALRDLKNLGEIVRPELPQTRQFYEFPKKAIFRHGPVGLVGYMHFLETLAVQSGPHLTRVISSCFGSNCCQFLQVHATEDIGHVKATEASLVELTTAELDLVDSLIQTASRQYGKVLEAIIEKSKQKIPA